MVDKDGLRKARDFYKKAIEEYKRAKACPDRGEGTNDVLFRDAGEKGWNAIVLATNYIIKEITGKSSKSNKERRKNLREVEAKNGKLKRYRFYERFAARAYILHMNCFYDGIYTEDELEENLKKVKEYIGDAEKVINKGLNPAG
ncbi:MAG: hypothetical protein COS84_00360 [Armatimonadetes bacterium CG07_land_8_20_14_0_80_40_9]|nr:MAG: hypothetical protein COS84_00360 [Armatimonadetes bacterium CG07_land_8_20_14_0_80_40_9]